MSKLLYIKANCKPENESRTFKISDRFIEEYKKSHPMDEIIVLDLYKENIDFIRADDFKVIFQQEKDRSHPIIKYAYEFAEADKYVIAAPMWNLNFPAILKAYIDYISIPGITFKYTEKGPMGLLKGKKLMLITSRGSKYIGRPSSKYEMGERYLRTIMGFFGVDDFTTIAAEGLDISGQDVDAILEKAIEEAKEKARYF